MIPRALVPGVAKIEIKRVAQDDFKIGPVRELGAKDVRKLGVAIDGNHPFRNLRESGGQRAQARPNLDHHLGVSNLGRGHDAFLHPWIHKKVLAKGFLGR